PALIIPHGYDQFDNAIRTQKMGVTQRLKTSQVNPETLTRTIQAILNDKPMQQKAQEISQQLKSAPDGAQTAAQHIIDCISQ
ncbi:MAG: glycosyltransferase, partial [Planctomycetota bacterium]